jgi:hypothetical protein
MIANRPRREHGPVPRAADTQDVRELVEVGAQLLEVLPKSAFAREHLPGAVTSRWHT